MVPNYERAPAAVFRPGAWAASMEGSGAEVEAADDECALPEDIAVEAETVRAWAWAKAQTLPTRDRSGKLKWTPAQLAEWGDDFCRPLPNPGLASGAPTATRFQRSRRGSLVRPVQR